MRLKLAIAAVALVVAAGVAFAAKRCFASGGCAMGGAACTTPGAPTGLTCCASCAEILAREPGSYVNM